MSLLNDALPGSVGQRAVNKALTLPTYTVATVPAAANYKDRLIIVSNGAAGQPCIAISNGTSWLRVLLGAAVATS